MGKPYHDTPQYCFHHKPDHESPPMLTHWSNRPGSWEEWQYIHVKLTF